MIQCCSYLQKRFQFYVLLVTRFSLTICDLMPRVICCHVHHCVTALTELLVYLVDPEKGFLVFSSVSPRNFSPSRFLCYRL